MKIAVCLLLVAISCCVSPAASNCRKKCSSACRQSQLTDVSCLQKALLTNMPATVDAMTNFLCAYDKAKVSENKAVLLRSIRTLQGTAGCNLANLLGTGTTLVALSVDVHGVLQYLLRAVYDLMTTVNIGDYIVPQCGQVTPLLTKVSRVLLLYAVPSFIGQSQATVTLDRVSHLLALVQIRSPELLQHLLEGLVGQGSLARELALTSRITGRVLKLAGDVGKTLHGTTQTVTDLTGGVLQSIGGTAGSAKGSDGLLTGLLPPVIGVVNGVVRTLGDTVGTVTNTVEGLLGGPNGGILSATSGLLGNLVNPNNGILGTVKNILPGPLGGVLGESKNGPLSLVTNLLGGVLGGNEGGSTGKTIAPSLSGGRGRDDLATFQASGAVNGNLDSNLGIFAGGQYGISKSITNTGKPQENMMENGGVQYDLEGSVSGSEALTMETPDFNVRIFK